MRLSWIIPENDLKILIQETETITEEDIQMEITIDTDRIRTTLLSIAGVVGIRMEGGQDQERITSMKVGLKEITENCKFSVVTIVRARNTVLDSELVDKSLWVICLIV